MTFLNRSHVGVISRAVEMARQTTVLKWSRMFSGKGSIMYLIDQEIIVKQRRAWEIPSDEEKKKRCLPDESRPFNCRKIIVDLTQGVDDSAVFCLVLCVFQFRLLNSLELSIVVPVFCCLFRRRFMAIMLVEDAPSLRDMLARQCHEERTCITMDRTYCDTCPLASWR